MHDYTVVSPSLDGILKHDSLTYECIERPLQISRLFERLSSRHVVEDCSFENREIIQNYFHDLYSILIKRLTHFAIEPNPPHDEPVKILAMVHELVKLKKLLGENKTISED